MPINFKYFIVVFSIASCITGCASTDNDMSGALGTAPMTKSAYFSTVEAKFNLRFRAGASENTYYIKLLRHPKFLQAAYLEVQFENPQNAEEPFTVYKELSAYDSTISFESPEIFGYTYDTDYRILVKIYRDKSRSEFLGEHEQWVRSFREDFLME